jgi:hypothetical protein
MIPNTKEEYDAMYKTEDLGSVKLLRAFVNKLLEEKGYAKLKGYKSMKELIAIKLKTMKVI